MKRTGKIGFVFGLAAFTTACTAILGVNDVPVPSDGGVTSSELGQAIESYSQAFCQRYADCFPKLFVLGYADVAECTQLSAAYLTVDTVLPGYGATPADFQGCTARTAAVACDTILSGDSAFLCNLKGTKQVGDLCVNDSQCASGLCESDAKTCRACIAPPALNQPCSKNGKCGPGLVCNSNLNCVNDVAVGGACSADAPCNLGLACIGGKCVQPPDVGQACNATEGCDTLKGLVCETFQAPNICIDVEVSGPGEICGILGNTFYACLRAKCDTSTFFCPQIPKEGDPCDAAGNVDCPFGTECTNNICVRPVPPSGCQ